LNPGVEPVDRARQWRQTNAADDSSKHISSIWIDWKVGNQFMNRRRDGDRLSLGERLRGQQIKPESFDEFETFDEKPEFWFDHKVLRREEIEAA
jgi:hypothetical protein